MSERFALAAVVLTLAVGWSCSQGPAPQEPLRLVDLPYAVVSASREAALSSPVTLGDDTRECLNAPTPSEVRFHLRVPPRAVLTFAIGIKPISDVLPEGGRLGFSIRAGERSASETVFQREIHVGRTEQWIEQKIDLHRFAGKSVWLSFETRSPGDSPEAGLVGLFADPVLHDRASYRQGRAVVMISLDTLRRDHSGVYGYRRRTTPGLQGLASEAVTFEDAISTSSWTLPAHASLFTSLYPSAHGAVNLHTRLSDSQIGLPSIFREAGFSTLAIVTHLYLSQEYGFGTGFDRHLYLPEARAEQVTDRAIAWLEAMGDRDLFLFLHYYDPHWHYDPPPPYDRAFYPAYRGGVTGIWWDFKEWTQATIEPEDLRRIVSLYDGEIAYTDRHLQRLFRAMKSLGIFDGALIIVTSDHGEEFLEHGGWEHQKTLYEEQLRIPLIMKLPGGEEGGARVHRQVSLVDVAPTVCELMGWASLPSFQGRSVLPLIRGLNSREGTPVSWSETEHTVDGSHKISLRRGANGEKWILSLLPSGNASVIEVYDLQSDPREHNNRLAEAADVEAVRARVEDYLRVAEERRLRAPAPPVDLSPEQFDKLRSLGYVP